MIILGNKQKKKIMILGKVKKFRSKHYIRLNVLKNQLIPKS